MTNDHEQLSPRIYSVKELAGGPGHSEKSIRREIAAGNIEIVRLGPGQHRIGIMEEAWVAYLKSRKR